MYFLHSDKNYDLVCTVKGAIQLVLRSEHTVNLNTAITLKCNLEKRPSEAFSLSPISQHLHTSKVHKSTSTLITPNNLRNISWLKASFIASVTWALLTRGIKTTYGPKCLVRNFFIIALQSFEEFQRSFDFVVQMIRLDILWLCVPRRAFVRRLTIISPFNYVFYIPEIFESAL